jgi:ribonuclease HII
VLLQSNKSCPDWTFEQKAKQMGFSQVAGIDEAGRGPLAGPVVAACCILPNEGIPDGIDDSKKLTPIRRHELFYALTERLDLFWSVGVVSPEKIDEINILEATKLAMKQAVMGMKVQPDYLLVDGLKLQTENIPSEKIIKGDQKSLSVAAASIIAKVWRDQIMEEYDKQYPKYGFIRHKGYGTKAHLQAIAELGLTPIHRTTFNSRIKEKYKVY